jgi:hypothetical protein
MAIRIDDRWLWLGFGVLSVLAISGIRLAFKDLIYLTRLDSYGYKPEPELSEIDSQRPEDSTSDLGPL